MFQPCANFVVFFFVLQVFFCPPYLSAVFLSFTCLCCVFVGMLLSFWDVFSIFLLFFFTLRLFFTMILLRVFLACFSQYFVTFLLCFSSDSFIILGFCL